MEIKDKHPKVEAYLREDIRERKAWAKQKEKEEGREWPSASEVSKKMLHDYLDKSEDELLEERYAYFKMRAHAFGTDSKFPIDPQAKEKWEELTGETIK